MENSVFGYTKFERFSCEEILPKYNCRNCYFMADLHISLNEHIWNNHKGFQKYTKTDFKMKSLYCKNCNFKSYSLLIWFTHQMKCAYIPHPYRKKHKQLKTPYKSAQILSEASTSVDLKHANDEKLASESLFNCELCEFKSKRRDILEVHYLKHKLTQKFLKHKCSQCPFETLDKEKLTQHDVTVHKEVKMFSRGYYNYNKGRRKYILKPHIITQHLPEDLVYYKCSHCFFHTLYKQNLREHNIKYHAQPEEIKWFECDKCEYKAKFKRNLTRHVIRRHSVVSKPLVNGV